MNNNNFNQKELNKIMNDAKKKSGVDFSKMKKAADNGNLDDFLSNNLSVEANNKIQNILKDENATKEILSSPQAKEILNKLFKE